MPRNYWMIVTTPENFDIMRSQGFKIQGIKANHHRKAQRIEPGDCILYYVGRERFFGATARATSRYSEDPSPPWKKDGLSKWAYKVDIEPEVVLNNDEYIDANQLAPRLDYVRKWTPESWYIAFAQTNLHLLPKKDFQLVEQEMKKLTSRAGRNRRRTLSRKPPKDIRIPPLRPEAEDDDEHEHDSHIVPSRHPDELDVGRQISVPTSNGQEDPDGDSQLSVPRPDGEEHPAHAD